MGNARVHAGEEVEQVPMLDHHRPPAFAGVADGAHAGQVGSGGTAARVAIRHLLDPGIVEADNLAFKIRQPVPVIAEHQRGAAVGEALGQAIRRAGGIERHHGTPCLQDRKRADHEVEAPTDQQAHGHARPGAAVGEDMGDAVGARLHPGEAEALILEDQRRIACVGVRPGGDRVVHGLRPPHRVIRRIPALDQQIALGFGENVDPGHSLRRARGHSGQDMAKPFRHQPGLGRGDQCGIGMEDQSLLERCQGQGGPRNRAVRRDRQHRHGPPPRRRKATDKVGGEGPVPDRLGHGIGEGLGRLRPVRLHREADRHPGGRRAGDAAAMSEGHVEGVALPDARDDRRKHGQNRRRTHAFRQRDRARPGPAAGAGRRPPFGRLKFGQPVDPVAHRPDDGDERRVQEVGVRTIQALPRREHLGGHDGATHLVPHSGQPERAVGDGKLDPGVIHPDDRARRMISVHRDRLRPADAEDPAFRHDLRRGDGVEGQPVIEGPDQFQDIG